MTRLRDIIEAKERSRLMELLRDEFPKSGVRENWAGVFVTGIQVEQAQAVEQSVVDAGFSRTDVTVSEDGSVKIFIRVKGAPDLIEKCLKCKKGKKK